jgi:hypothetical protein
VWIIPSNGNDSCTPLSLCFTKHCDGMEKMEEEKC